MDFAFPKKDGFKFPTRQHTEISATGAGTITIIQMTPSGSHEVISFHPTDVPGVIEALKRCMESALEVEDDPDKLP